MNLKFSEMCAVRTDLALKLEAAFENYEEEIAEGFGGYLSQALEDGEPELDVRFQLALLRRKVRSHRQRLDSIDEGVLDQIHGDEKVRAELIDRAEAVDNKLRRVRSAFRGFFGLDQFARVGLEGEFPRGLLRLHRHATTVKNSLMSSDLELEPLLEVNFADTEGQNASAWLGQQLEPELSRLGELLDERHQENTRTTDVRLQRQDVIREFDYHIRGVVRMVQGMFRLAGRNDLAVRIRPILQRVLRKLEDPEAPEPAETEAASAETETAQTTEPETSEGATPKIEEPAAPEPTTA